MVAEHRLPSLIAIRAFEAAARHGSFAKAAEELDTTAASVSYHVRRLEQQTGVRLFVRHAQHVALTEQGMLVAREATSAFDTLRASFLRATQNDEARLSLTTLPSLGTSWLTPKLGRFRSQHANVSLELDLSPNAEDLTTSRFDAAIRNGHGRWPGLRAHELFPSMFMPLCAPHLKSAAAAIGDPNRCVDLPLLGRHDWWTLWYRARGCAVAPPPDRFRTTLSSEYLDIAAAVAGQGIAIGSPILFAANSMPGASSPRTISSPATAARSGSSILSRANAHPRSRRSANGSSKRPRATVARRAHISTKSWSSIPRRTIERISHGTAA